MSDPAAPGGSGGDEMDGLAAEYALGTLDAEDARRAEALMQDDAAFRAAVEAWERRLAPLAALVLPHAPPLDLWSRIEASTRPFSGVSSGASASLDARRKLRFWRGATAAAVALAAGIAAFAILREPPGGAGPANPVVAVLAPATAGPVFVAEAAGEGLRLRPASGAAQVAPGKDWELWVLPAGASRPESLGVLPAAGRTLATRPPPGAQLLVSLEPQGGSPTGQPTGPVVSAGRLPPSG
jgi:anti-sigma-K factor RskA